MGKSKTKTNARNATFGEAFPGARSEVLKRALEIAQKDKPQKSNAGKTYWAKRCVERVGGLKAEDILEFLQILIDEGQHKAKEESGKPKWYSPDTIAQVKSKLLDQARKNDIVVMHDQSTLMDDVVHGYSTEWASAVESGQVKPPVEVGEINGARLEAIVAEARRRGEKDIADGWEAMYGCGGRGQDVENWCRQLCPRVAEGEVKVIPKNLTPAARITEGLEVHAIFTDEAQQIFEERDQNFARRGERVKWFPKRNQPRANKIIADVVKAKKTAKLFVEGERYATHGIRHAMATNAAQKALDAAKSQREMEKRQIRQALCQA